MNSYPPTLYTNKTDYADFQQIALDLQKSADFQNNSSLTNLKIACLSNFTITGVQNILIVKCAQIGLKANIHISEYNQYSQQILNPSSTLYQFNPDIIILSLSIKTLLADLFYNPYSITDSQRKQWVENQLADINDLLQSISKYSNCHVLIHDFESPTYSPLGNLENKQDYGYFESIHDLNQKLKKLAKPMTQINVVEYDAFVSNIGNNNIQDPKMVLLGDIQCDFKNLSSLCDLYIGYISPLYSKSKKCLVLDLDGVLWGGVLGEDGIDGIQLGPHLEGRAFWNFQKHILALWQRGVILAINSRNNEKDVLELFKSHPYMILKKTHFAACQINWNNKSTNMIELSKELNLSLDSFVFMDDTPAQRDQIRSMLPEVTVIEMPEDSSNYEGVLKQLNLFNTTGITTEDTQRGQQYQDQKNRMDYKKNKTLDQFLNDLETVVIIEDNALSAAPRIAQLTQKTNQFNLTTQRYTLEDIKDFFASPRHKILTLKASDKFGDQGLVGVCIIEILQNNWCLDTLLMSCRVLGRRIEEAFLFHVLSEAKSQSIQKVIGKFSPTPKNAPAKDFYNSHGFKKDKTNNNIELWVHSLNDLPTNPNCIKLKIERMA